MKLFSVAIGTQYEKESQRLVRSLNQPVEVLTESSEQYEVKSEDPLINGLYHKANFANYITDAEEGEPVVFMDADMFTLSDNPFAGFSVPEDADIAYVPYTGRWWLPDEIRQSAFDFHEHKINSGFLYFKDIEVAKTVCDQWAFEYLEREKLYDVEQGTSKYEYDKWALMIALKKLNLNVHLLDKKWNDWELATEEDIRSSDSVFFQSHDNLDIV
jgi:hypothetical protein